MFEVNGGVSFDDGIDDGFGSTETTAVKQSEIRKLKVEDILGTLGYSISFDIAKNHTGICIWDGKNVVLDGFDIEYNYDKDDALADCKMRHWFKERCRTILQGKHFDVCQVEGIYAGENVDTFRKLAILNTVVGELYLEGVFEVDRYFNLIKSEWFKHFKMIGREGRGLKSKLETQEILRRLEFPFALEYIDKPKAEQEKVFFEDKCDAVGMLCGVALALNSDVNLKKSSSFGLRDIKQYYLWEYEDLEYKNDPVIKKIEPTFFTLHGKTNKTIEEEIKNLLLASPDKVFACCVSNADASLYIHARGWELSPNEEGYLVFYRKDILKYANVSS